MTSAHEHAEPARPHAWIDWYRFAREELDLSHGEGAEYANRRWVEEQNRDVLRGDGADRLSVRPSD
jgi:hypothetical protein